MQFFDVAVEVDSENIDPDRFEQALSEAAGEQPISVAYEWGVTVFMPIVANDLLESISTALNIVKRTGADITGIDSDLSDLDTHVVNCNAYRATGVGKIDLPRQIP